jgi:hypothetical protein
VVCEIEFWVRSDGTPLGVIGAEKPMVVEVTVDAVGVY